MSDGEEMITGTRVGGKGLTDHNWGVGGKGLTDHSWGVGGLKVI